MGQKRILIVGGVAAGATAAVRSRRLDETARIIVFERGPHVSFANCGLPYHLGGVIADEAALILSSPERFQDKFDIEVRVLSEVLGIDRERRELLIRDRQSGGEYVEAYDALVLAPGAKPLRPPLPGIDLPGVFSLRTVPDVRHVREWIAQQRASRAVVVGAGFIGLEVAENLVRLGLAVDVIEAQQQVFAPVDREMAEPMARNLEQNGVRLHLSQRLEVISSKEDGALEVATAAGDRITTDLVILALGVRPEADLAGRAGLTVGEHGGIIVSASMQTSDPNIWAAGDVVEHTCFVTEDLRTVPLAGLANRQGRVVADSIAGRAAQLRGMQGTFVCEVFEQAELAYSPQFGAAKDPVNLAGMIAANQLRGDVRFARWEDLPHSSALLVDVREPAEYAAEHVPSARSVPLPSLREHSEELPRDRELWLYCETGKRSYDAARLLSQRGLKVRALPGGIQTWRQFGAPVPG